jgi:TonB-linked SusC/RagA family outer membrane protein
MMKLIVLCTIISLQITAASFAQQITLNYKNAPLREVLQSIRKQTGYYFFFSSEYLEKATPVSVSVTDATLENTLAVVFKGQPFEYAIKGKMITIKPVEQSEADRDGKFVSVITVRGKVMDEEGNPLPGVSVVLKEKNSKMAVTDQQGRFTFDEAPDKGTLLIRMIGRETKEVVYRTAEPLTIVLKQLDADLKEVQIIAYGEVDKKFSTTNAATIGSDVIGKQPVSNPLLALGGQVPGLFVRQLSGVSASNVDVVVQGRNSLSNGNAPFYVIDGVPYSPQFTTSSLMGGAISGQGGSTLNFINPSDIESITILKDADATAIYGSRAANGAILITTKKGKSGKTKVDLNLQNGWGKITRKLNLLNTEEYLNLRKEAYTNAGLDIPNATTPPSASNFDLTIWDQKKNTDWQSELVGGTARFTNLQASISGGNANTQFLTGYGYIRESSVYPGNLSDSKGNLHFNITHNSDDSKFHYLLSGSYLEDRNKLNLNDLMVRAIILAPNAPDMFNADGSLNWFPVPGRSTSSFIANPGIFIKQPFSSHTNNLIANNTLSYDIIPGLKLKSSMGFNRLASDEIQLTPLSSIRPDASTRNRSARYLTKSIISWIIEPQITYNRETDIGTFDVLIGSTFQRSKTNVLSQTGTGHTSDLKLEDIASASTVTINNTIYALYKYNALFGRLNYRIANKYVLNVTARRDGSSRFGAENRFNNFYSVGGAWLFKEEDWVKQKATWLSTGKLRINYGTTGNDQINDYRYLSSMSPYSIGVGMPYQGSTGLYPTNIANPQLQWEETRKLNVGLDLGFLKNQLLFSGNYFRNRSSNQLIPYIVPSTTGFGSIDQNLAATVQNTGFEFQIDAKIQSSGNLKWYSSANLTIPRNKLVAFPGLKSSTYAEQYEIGKPINVMRLYPFAGVNPQTGLYQFINVKGELTSTPDYTVDRTQLVDLNPKFYGGLTNTFSYKGLELSFFLHFVKQLGAVYRFGNSGGNANANQPTYFLNRWRKPGDLAEIQKVSLGGDTDESYGAAFDSDAAYGDASFIRLRNASLSYSLPASILKPALISRINIYVQGQNLLTITRFKGTDPETQTETKLPPLRMFTAGAEITF